jgi:hypothetical protein
VREPDGEIGGRAHVESAVARECFYARDIAPRFAAVAAGIHRQRAAHGSRYAGEKLGVGTAVHRGEARELRARDARIGVDHPVRHREDRAGVVHQDHRAANAAVAHEHVAAESEGRDRQRRGQAAHE